MSGEPGRFRSPLVAHSTGTSTGGAWRFPSVRPASTGVDAERVRHGWARVVTEVRRGADSRAGGVIVMLLAAAVYFGVRHLTEGRAGTAQIHARQIESVEHGLGIDRELWVQRHTVPHHWIMTSANDIYVYGHWPVIVVALVWLLVRHRDHFDVARNALLLSGGVALVVFAVFPVAPPRLADPAIIDTITLHTDAYRILQPAAFTNAYAAMPSLHCGWDLLVAFVLARTVRSRLLAGVIRVLPLLMVASVLITGNHYVIDAVAGDALALGALAVATSLARRGDTAAAVPGAPASPVPAGTARGGTGSSASHH